MRKPWKDFEDKKITFEELRTSISKILKDYSKFIKEEIQREELEEIAEEMGDAQNIEEFDETMVSLYDWGDQVMERKFGEEGFANTPKMAWIATIFD